MRRILACLALALLLALPARAAEPGLYAADIAVSDDAFGFTDAIALVAEAGVTLRLTATTGEGETLIVGGQAVEPTVNARGEITYTLPIAALDEPATLSWRDAEGAAHSLTLTVLSEDLTPLGGGAESADENEPIPLADGTYAVADFAFSGGSGKTTISCEALWVEGGEATARIVFSSPHYGYVKVDGAKYEGMHGERTSAFEIPMRLGADTVILAMTTAMSAPHEIEYTLRVTPGERME